MKRSAFFAVLALTSLSSLAANYFVVVPLKGKTAPEPTLALSLQAAVLPEASVGEPYSYDLRQHLLVSGDPDLDLNQAVLSTQSVLPPGFSLSSSGTLSGTPSTPGPEGGSSIQVQASYKTATGQQVYTLVINGQVLEVTKLVAGMNHTCGLTPQGGVRCWGYNNSGQLGDGTLASRYRPTDVTGLTSGVVSLAAGAYHTCAVMQDSTAKCWGGNGWGQLGDGTGTQRSIPVTVANLSGVESLAAGTNHTCAKLSSGSLKCWGYNGIGQFGVSSPSSSTTPVAAFEGISDVRTLAASQSGDFTCVIRSSGTVYCAGANAEGELGDGSMTTRKTPVQVSGLTGVTALGLGRQHSCAVTNAGALKCWGLNNMGQLGDNTNVTRLTPVDVSGLSSGVKSVAGGLFQTCAVMTTGAMKCWGYNNDGQLGIGVGASRAVPSDVTGLPTGVAGLATGNHTCALLTTGAMKCWGYNGYGQVGDGSTSTRYLPVDVLP